MRNAVPLLCWILLAVALVTEVQGQAVSDLRLGEEADSLSQVEYPYIFPIWGKKVVERGFDLPYPLGIMLNVIQVQQSIVIDSVKVGINDSRLVEVGGLINFESVSSTFTSATLRPDLWIFPFLDIYGLFGPATGTTTVKIDAPFSLETEVDLNGYTYGVGTTVAGGVGRFFVIADINWTWTELDRLSTAARARVFSARLGRAFKLGEQRNVAFWVGAMNQSVKASDLGDVLLSEVIDPDPQKIEEIKAGLEEVFDALPPSQKVVIREIIDALQDKLDGRPGDPTITYALNKRLEDPWNMVAGGQFQVNKRWQFRVEAGFIGRTSLLFSVNYRFPL